MSVCPILKSVYGPRRRVIAIGDIHGDIDIAIECLTLAKVIESRTWRDIKWIGGDTIVVQVGDQIDDYRPEIGEVTNLFPDIDVLRFFNFIDKKAKKHNGAVVSLLGNHELMNVYGNTDYVSNASLKFMSKRERLEKFKPGNEYARLLACTRLAAVIIGSCLFVHAGITPSFAKSIGLKDRSGIEEINIEMRKWLLGEIKETNKLKLLRTEDSLFWTRLTGQTNQATCSTNVTPVLKLLNIGSMIIGHTPQIKGIKSACNESVWKTDTGLSKAFAIPNRKIQVLEILNDKVFNVLEKT